MTEKVETYDVVVIGPHPDDVEMSMAGTVIRLVRAGYRVLNVSVTRGERGTYGTVDTRQNEFTEANRLMGSVGRLLDFPDTAVANDYDGKLTIARLIRETRPQVVFAPYHTNPFGHHDGSANVDHYTTGQLVRDGLKLARFVNLLPGLAPYDVPYLYYYMVPKNMMPTMVVDVTSVIDEVWSAIRAYDTQMQIQRRSNSILELLETLRRYHGMRIGVRFGEAFASDESLPYGPHEFFGPRA
jgi:LmbE family N-acetylglucosaminyl deacetylase